MVNSDELLCIVDEFDTPLKPVQRKVAFDQGYWKRCVHVWIINHKGQILCQKRSSKKDISPGMWEPMAGGHAGPGDNYFTAAAREVFEETGLPVSVTDLNLVKIYKDNYYKEYRGVFFCKTTADISSVNKEDDEVEHVKFINLHTLKKYLLYQKSSKWIRYGYEKEMFSLLNKS